MMCAHPQTWLYWKQDMIFLHWKQYIRFKYIGSSSKISLFTTILLSFTMIVNMCCQFLCTVIFQVLLFDWFVCVASPLSYLLYTRNIYFPVYLIAFYLAFSLIAHLLTICTSLCILQSWFNNLMSPLWDQ